MSEERWECGDRECLGVLFLSALEQINATFFQQALTPAPILPTCPAPLFWDQREEEGADVGVMGSPCLSPHHWVRVRGEKRQSLVAVCPPSWRIPESLRGIACDQLGLACRFLMRRLVPQHFPMGTTPHRMTLLWRHQGLKPSLQSSP